MILARKVLPVLLSLAAWSVWAQAVPRESQVTPPASVGTPSPVVPTANRESTIQYITALLGAVAALLWPIFAFTTLFLFKTEIRQLLARLKRGKLLGQEIELTELTQSLVKLQESAVAATADVAAIPSTGDVYSNDEGVGSDFERQVIETASRSPTAAVLALAVEIEKQVFQLVASLGDSQDRNRTSITQVFRRLVSAGSLPQSVVSSVEMFLDIRNRLVHHPTAGAPRADDVLSAIDSGIIILRALRGVPCEINTVYHPGVDVYADSQATNRRDGVKGVILETTSVGGATKTRRIFPTTGTHFTKGRRVAWEWNHSKKFGESWYRDPDTQEVKCAWTGSLEFVGRHLDDV